MGKNRSGRKSVIPSAAHFVLCEDCREHGRIVFSNGSRSDECCSIDVALFHLQSGLELGLMQEVEVPFLRAQINESGLDPDIGPKDLSVAMLELAVR